VTLPVALGATVAEMVEHTEQVVVLQVPLEQHLQLLEVR
jgi:hypothetical protein